MQVRAFGASTMNTNKVILFSLKDKAPWAVYSASIAKYATGDRLITFAWGTPSAAVWRKKASVISLIQRHLMARARLHYSIRGRMIPHLARIALQTTAFRRFALREWAH
jgi:hypothetical protein